MADGDEETRALLRAIKEQLNRIEARQVEMYERQGLIKAQIAEQPVQGSFASSE
jgi:hypothetical protein